MEMIDMDKQRTQKDRRVKVEYRERQKLWN